MPAGKVTSFASGLTAAVAVAMEHIPAPCCARCVHSWLRLFPVVAQEYKLEVEVLGASRGCTAVLRCVVPSFVKELIRVVSWVQEPSFYIYPSLQGGKDPPCPRSGGP